MLAPIDIEKRLHDQAEMFDRHMQRKEYAEAKRCYDNARAIAVGVGLEESKMIKLFGSRHTDPPVEGLFPESLVQKAYIEYIKSASEAEEAQRRPKEMQTARASDRRRTRH